MAARLILQSGPTADQKLAVIDGLFANGFHPDAILAASYIATRPNLTVDDLREYDADANTDMAGQLGDLLRGHYVVEGRAGTLAISPYEELEPTAPAASGEARIRAAYASLNRPARFVRLTSLRPLLVDLDRRVVDEALDHMITLPDVWLLGEENQKVLRPADRAAAVEIGGEFKHYLAIGRQPII